MHLMTPRLGIAKPGWIYFVPLLLAAALLVGIGLWWAAILPGIAGLYTIYFFRDPERRVPGIPHSICSPADGRVASVVEVPCDRMPSGRARRVAVFLNVFNVHVQRAPIGGTVVAVERRPGRYMNALNEKCSEENEAVTIWLETDMGIVGVRQIAGAIARRIVCAAKVGDRLERGDRYGLIQFGSRVEVFLPTDSTVKVQPGQKVSSGVSCLAVLFEEEVKRGYSREAVARIAVGVGPE